MARKGITYDQVANAAAAIKARGTEPTIAAIRVELGGEGSYTTISQHLAKWKDNRATDSDNAELPPEEIQNSFMEAGIKAWNVAKKAAREEIAALKQEHQDERKKLGKELDESAEEIKTLEEALETAKAEAEKAKHHAADLEKKYTAASGELEATQKLYKQLLESLKQPTAGADKKAVDTKPARQQAKAPAPESKPGETH